MLAVLLEFQMGVAQLVCCLRHQTARRYPNFVSQSRHSDDFCKRVCEKASVFFDIQHSVAANVSSEEAQCSVDGILSYAVLSDTTCFAHKQFLHFSLLLVFAT